MKRGFLLLFLFILYFYERFCYGSANTMEVENNIKTSQALSGLKVNICCKLEDGKFQTIGVGNLNEEGQLKVNLTQEILKDRKLSEECHVQLHNAANAPCGPTEQLRFPSVLSMFSTVWPPFPKSHPWYKKFHQIFPNPPVVLPPIPNEKSFPPPVVKPEPKIEPKPEPKTKTKPEPNIAPKPEPEPKPKSEPKPQPKHKSKPNPDLKPKPKGEPKHDPKHKPEPKPEPKPKLEPKPEPNPKLEPKPEPNPNLEPEPKPKPKPCPPKVSSPHFTVYKPHPKIFPPIPPIHKKNMPATSSP